MSTFDMQIVWVTESFMCIHMPACTYAICICFSGELHMLLFDPSNARDYFEQAFRVREAYYKG